MLTSSSHKMFSIERQPSSERAIFKFEASKSKQRIDGVSRRPLRGEDEENVCMWCSSNFFTKTHLHARSKTAQKNWAVTEVSFLTSSKCQLANFFRSHACHYARIDEMDGWERSAALSVTRRIYRISRFCCRPSSVLAPKNKSYPFHDP